MSARPRRTLRGSLGAALVLAGVSAFYVAASVGMQVCRVVAAGRR